MLSVEQTAPAAVDTAGASRRRFGFALALSAAVPALVLVSLSSNLVRPFWYNEVWRAYFITKPGDWWAALRTDNAPFPAGWYLLERASSSVFGSTELALRLPTALFLPAGSVLLFLLARRWMPLAAAVVVSLVGSLTGALLVFAVQLAEYPLDAAASVAVLLFHQLAGDVEPAGWRSGRLYLAYGGIVAACVFSTPALFLAAPLLMWDAWRALRSPPARPGGAAATGAGVLILMHLGLFVIRQNTLTKGSYWAGSFLPHHGVGAQLGFVWHHSQGYVSALFTTSTDSKLSPLLGPGWSEVLTACFAVLLGAGVLEWARSARGRVLLGAVIGSQILTLVASYIHYWPFGFERTNYFMVPLLILVAGVGAAALVTGAGRAATGRHRRPSGPSRAVTAAGRVAVTTVACVATALAVTYEISTYRQIRASATNVAYGDHIGAAVDTVARRARAGAAVVVAGGMAIRGWQYYESQHSGHPWRGAYPVPADHVLFVSTHGSPAISGLVAAVNPPEVFLYVPFGATGTEVNLDIAAIQRSRRCRTGWAETFPGSGLLTLLACDTSPPSG